MSLLLSLIVGIVLGGEARHDLHVSYGNLGLEGTTAILQIRIFKDDLEEALLRFDEREPFRLEVTPEMDALFLRYLAEKFVLEVDGKTLPGRILGSGYDELLDSDWGLVVDIYESVFEHARFTGRSGTFYGYEGLGSIYWHMVSKLLLAVQEVAVRAAAEGSEDFAALAERYYDVRAGLGFNKAPDVYGAFPTDPYSHTPANAGAKQPGMTGMVKEEILTRLGELGLWVSEGQVRFDPVLLRPSEFLETSETFRYFDLEGRDATIELEPGTLAFTYCQVPVVYRRSDARKIDLHLADGTVRTVEGWALDGESSAELFRRTGSITRVEVSLRPGL